MLVAGAMCRGPCVLVCHHEAWAELWLYIPNIVMLLVEVPISTQIRAKNSLSEAPKAVFRRGLRPSTLPAVGGKAAAHYEACAAGRH